MSEETVVISTEDESDIGFQGREEIERHSEWVFRGRCVRVVDGDTYDILCDCGFGIYHKIRVRLRAVDTPEKYGKNACEEGKEVSRIIDDILFDKEVLIRTIKKKASSYNRWEADVWYHNDDGQLVNIAEEIVKNEWGVLVDGYEL